MAGRNELGGDRVWGKEPKFEKVLGCGGENNGEGAEAMPPVHRIVRNPDSPILPEINDYPPAVLAAWQSASPAVKAVLSGSDTDED